MGIDGYRWSFRKMVVGADPSLIAGANQSIKYRHTTMAENDWTPQTNLPFGKIADWKGISIMSGLRKIT